MDGYALLVEGAHQSGGAEVLHDFLVRSHWRESSTVCATFKHKSSLDRPLSPAQRARMEHVGKRIAKARQTKGWSQGKLAEKVNAAQTTISSWERGRTEPSREDVVRIAAELGIPASQIEVGDHVAGPGYPLIGKVGAGGQGLYADDYSLGEAADYIEPLPGMKVDEEVIVLETDGDSMAPAVMDGDLAFFGPIRHDVETLLNKRVMAKLADGRKFFKILKRGSQPGLWTLRSLNPSAPDIEDVQVSWVLPYRGSKPRD